MKLVPKTFVKHSSYFLWVLTEISVQEEYRAALCRKEKKIQAEVAVLILVFPLGRALIGSDGFNSVLMTL